MKSILDNRPELVKEVNKVAEVAGYLWQKGWAERNGGNITVNITEYVDDEIRQMPIIEPRSFQRPVAYIETDRFYQMYFATRCRSRADDVARVLRDFRFYQNDIERHISLPYFILQSYHFCLSFSSVCQSQKKQPPKRLSFLLTCLRKHV